jgi:F-type H+-transporting ATPase subunit b
LDALRPLGIDPALLIAYLINFVVLLFLLRLFLYRPILNMMEERRQKIQESLDQADKVRQEAEIQRADFQRELENAHKTSQDATARVVQETEKMREAILAQARQEAEQIREQARQQIELERQQAAADLQRQVVDLAVDLTRKVIGQTVAVNEQAQRQLINQFLSEVGDLS